MFFAWFCFHFIHLKWALQFSLRYGVSTILIEWKKCSFVKMNQIIFYESLNVEKQNSFLIFTETFKIHQQQNMSHVIRSFVHANSSFIFFLRNTCFTYVRKCILFEHEINDRIHWSMKCYMNAVRNHPLTKIYFLCHLIDDYSIGCSETKCEGDRRKLTS